VRDDDGDGYERRRTLPALNRLVYFSDVAHLLRHGQTVSRRPQLKIRRGPLPRGSFEARCAAIRAGLLTERWTERRFEREASYLATAQASRLEQRFCAEELATLSAVRERLGCRTARFLARKAHESAPWRCGRFGFPLDLDLARTDARLIAWLRAEGVLPPEGNG
jgi:uncharacterized phage-associated protein